MISPSCLFAPNLQVTVSSTPALGRPARQCRQTPSQSSAILPAKTWSLQGASHAEARKFFGSASHQRISFTRSVSASTHLVIECSGRRVEKVAELIKREVSQMMMNDIKDVRLKKAGVASVTRVEVSGDLSICKVYVSVVGTDEERADIIAGLTSASGYIRKQLGQRLTTRLTPEVIIKEDRSGEHTIKVLGILRKIDKEREEKEQQKRERLASLTDPDNAEPEDSDDPEDSQNEDSVTAASASDSDSDELPYANPWSKAGVPIAAAAPPARSRPNRRPRGFARAKAESKSE